MDDIRKTLYSAASISAATAGMFLIYKYLTKTSKVAIPRGRKLKRVKEYVQFFTSNRIRDQ